MTSNFLFILSLLVKHLLKHYLKNKSGESFVGGFEDLDFSCDLLFFYEICVLLPNINFLSTKHNRILKFDPEVLKLYCPKAAIVFLRHTLT